jgi:hypothetical protein
MDKNKIELGMGQNLFEALQRVCDFTALEDDMTEILNAVIKDNEKQECHTVTHPLMYDMSQLYQSSEAREKSIAYLISQRKDLYDSILKMIKIRVEEGKFYFNFELDNNYSEDRCGSSPFATEFYNWVQQVFNYQGFDTSWSKQLFDQRIHRLDEEKFIYPGPTTELITWSFIIEINWERKI